jgi:glycosyltransferase involved in cell wall biosynthesis
VLVCNDPIAELLFQRGLPSDKATVVVNSADTKMFTAHSEGADSRGVTEKDSRASLIMMYHGTLTHIYGLDIAVHALREVRERAPELGVEFRILGTGPDRDSLVALVRELGLNGRVRFLGRVPLDQVPEHIAQCDVGLLPTRQDVFLDLSFSNKLVEYVVMGRPVIAARLKGYRRYFGEESLAFFQPGNPQSLADRIIRMALDRDGWPRWVENAFADYQSIRWEVMETRYLDVVSQQVELCTPGGFTDAPTV